VTRLAKFSKQCPKNERLGDEIGDEKVFGQLFFWGEI
jgi:hypothetical protein